VKLGHDGSNLLAKGIIFALHRLRDAKGSFRERFCDLKLRTRLTEAGSSYVPIVVLFMVGNVRLRGVLLVKNVVTCGRGAEETRVGEAIQVTTVVQAEIGQRKGEDWE